MDLRVIRKGVEIFRAGGVRPTLSFPFGTRLENIQVYDTIIEVNLAESPVEEGVLAVSYAERVLVENNLYIYAIKSYRTRTGVGLKAAKEAIDAERALIERGREGRA